MMMTIDGAPVARPFRLIATVDRWYGFGGANDPPDETIEVDAWFDVDGTEITDTATLAALTVRATDE